MIFSSSSKANFFCIFLTVVQYFAVHFFSIASHKLIHEFIDKIIVYAPRYLDGKRVQLMDIHYNGVCILRERSPEVMEEVFQEHLAERERSKAKTA